MKCVGGPLDGQDRECSDTYFQYSPPTPPESVTLAVGGVPRKIRRSEPVTYTLYKLNLGGEQLKWWSPMGTTIPEALAMVVNAYQGSKIDAK